MPEKMQQIIAAIKALNPETDFTAGGKPKVDVLASVVGFDISADERDAAWQAYQESSAPTGDTDQTNVAEEAPAAPAKKTGPITIADVVAAKRAQGMKI